MPTTRLPCYVCKGEIPYGRSSNFCSKKCQAKVEGYTKVWEQKLDLDKVRAQILASTAWAPPEPEPAKHLITPYPVLVINDVHCPMQCAIWAYQAILAANKFGCRICIINGDLINGDQISKYLNMSFRRKATLEDDMDAAEKFLELLCSLFDEVYYTLGNHTQRLIQMSNGELSIQRLLKMIFNSDKMKVSAKTWMIVNDNVRVLHPRSYSQVRGKLTADIAQLYQCHLLTGHHHHFATTVTKDAKWQVVEVGCLANIRLMSYVQDDMKSMPFMCNGFAIIMPDSRILNFSEYTHWPSFGLPELRKAA